VAVGTGELDAAPDRGTRNDHLLRGQRGAVLARETFEEMFEKELEAVGECEPKHSGGLWSALRSQPRPMKNPFADAEEGPEPATGPHPIDAMMCRPVMRVGQR